MNICDSLDSEIPMTSPVSITSPHGILFDIAHVCEQGAQQATGTKGGLYQMSIPDPI
jgi:hypothetical protein